MKNEVPKRGRTSGGLGRRGALTVCLCLAALPAWTQAAQASHSLGPSLPPVPHPQLGLPPAILIGIILFLLLAWGISLWVVYNRPRAPKSGDLGFGPLDVSEEPAPAPVADDRALAIERLQKLNQLKEALLASGGLEEKLQTITTSLATLFDLDFCRIWLVKPGDLCEQGCVHAEYETGPHACANKESCLHLMASGGTHARIDSRMHQRVPFGCYKIGRVGAGQQRKFLTNDIRNDRRVPNPQWASDMGLVSFAGYKLVSPTGKPMGVLAFFARSTISEEEDAMMESMANSISEAIHAAQADDLLRESENKFRTLYEASSDAVVIWDGGRVADCNDSAASMFGEEEADGLQGMAMADVSPEQQPDGASSAEAADGRFDKALAGGSCRFEWRFRRSDGGEFPADVLFTAMEVDGDTLVQAVIRDITERKKAEEEREQLIGELREAIAQIKTLSGLLPICAACKKIRDDSGYWSQIEVYLKDHSDAEFSHSICPECMQKLYPEQFAKRHGGEQAGEDA